jgi:pullulanase/glycogen debranching enzyme
MLEKDRAKYANYTGAGNTLKANHSVVKRLILDSLRCTWTASASIWHRYSRATNWASPW